MFHEVGDEPFEVRYVVLDATEQLVAVRAQDAAPLASSVIVVKVQAVMPVYHRPLMLAANRTSAELSGQDLQVFGARRSDLTIPTIPDGFPDAYPAPSRLR